jgi:gas vesicle protein
MTGALVGALVGAATGYLFFTQRGQQMRDRIEPAIDNLTREFARFQKTIEKVSDIANEGLRVMNEITSGTSHSHFQPGGPPH